MIKIKFIFLLVLTGIFLNMPIAGCESINSEGTNLTVYNQNFAVVRDSRLVDLKNGPSYLSVQDIASSIDPTSVTIRPLKNKNAFKVAEQNYEYDMVNKTRLLEKYIGKEITIASGTGKLLASDQNTMIVEIDGKIKVLSQGQDSFEITLPELPENLILKPTLTWLMNSTIEGRELVEISYITSNINWKADYNAISDENDKILDLSGWVTLDNKCGAAFKNAVLKLIAGDVKIVTPQAYGRRGIMMAEAKSMLSDDELGFTEKSFFEYHMYTLGRPVTIKDKETKQIEFITSSGIPITKAYIYDGFKSGGFGTYSYWIDEPGFGKESANKKVSVALEFENKKENNLGIPLPKGKLRVYKKNSDGTLEFIGEDLIDHTPKDELLSIEIGNAFDVVGERKQIDYKTIISGHVYEESFEIKIKNHKDEDISVRVPEHLYRWSDWTITQASLDYKKKDSKTIEFLLKVPKNGENTITYTVQYKW